MNKITTVTIIIAVLLKYAEKGQKTFQQLENLLTNLKWHHVFCNVNVLTDTKLPHVAYYDCAWETAADFG